jgi:hypothetical protein
MRVFDEQLSLCNPFPIGYGSRRDESVHDRFEVRLLKGLGFEPELTSSPQLLFRNQIRFQLTRPQMVHVLHHLWMSGKPGHLLFLFTLLRALHVEMSTPSTTSLP